MWIEPKVVDARDFVPLTYLVKALQDMPIAQLEARVEALYAAQAAEHPGARQADPGAPGTSKGRW